MNRIEQLYAIIEGSFVHLRHELTTLAKPGVTRALSDLAFNFERYRTEVAKEMAGLKQDVRTAEAAYELRDAQAVRSHDLLRKVLGVLHGSIDQQGLLAEIESVVCTCGAQKITHPAEGNGYGVHLGTDPGSPEGDKTVVSWVCCGKMYSFTPPKKFNWTHDAACPSCGSRTTLNGA